MCVLTEIDIWWCNFTPREQRILLSFVPESLDEYIPLREDIKMIYNSKEKYLKFLEPSVITKNIISMITNCSKEEQKEIIEAILDVTSEYHWNLKQDFKRSSRYKKAKLELG